MGLCQEGCEEFGAVPIGHTLGINAEVKSRGQPASLVSSRRMAIRIMVG